MHVVKNISYSVIRRKTAHGMLNALLDMYNLKQDIFNLTIYEYNKRSASNKVYLIRQLVNMRVK